MSFFKSLGAKLVNLLSATKQDALSVVRKAGQSSKEDAEQFLSRKALTDRNYVRSTRNSHRNFKSREKYAIPHGYPGAKLARKALLGTIGKAVIQ